MNALRLFLVLVVLAACKEEVAEKPSPVELTEESVGFFCQMELLNHEGPKGQVHLRGLPTPLFFGQVGDAVAYLRMPEQSDAVLEAYVQDMSGAESWSKPGGWIAARHAYYVVGSDQMGGMGAPEFVPFSDVGAARAFSELHGGVVLDFDRIPAGVASDHGASAGSDQTDIAARIGALQDAAKDE